MIESLGKSQIDNLYERKLIKHYAKSAELFHWENIYNQYLKGKRSYEELEKNLFGFPMWDRMQKDVTLSANTDFNKIYGNYKIPA